MLNSVTNLKCIHFVKKTTDLLETLSHIIFNMSGFSLQTDLRIVHGVLRS
jgi:hypothetical protein